MGATAATSWTWQGQGEGAALHQAHIRPQRQARGYGAHQLLLRSLVLQRERSQGNQPPCLKVTGCQLAVSYPKENIAAWPPKPQVKAPLQHAGRAKQRRSSAQWPAPPSWGGKAIVVRDQPSRAFQICPALYMGRLLILCFMWRTANVPCLLHNHVLSIGGKRWAGEHVLKRACICCALPGSAFS